MSNSDAITRLGFRSATDEPVDDDAIARYLDLKLAAHGAPTFGNPDDSTLLRLGRDLLGHLRDRNRLAEERLCPADEAIVGFLGDYLADELGDGETVRLPNAMVLDRHGLARGLSLPPDRDVYESAIIRSYRVFQGVCHNPVHDRRTTAGVFHVVAGGFPVPADKKEVPKKAFAALLAAAVEPTPELMQLPFTSTKDEQAEVWLTLLLRPTVCPEVAGFTKKKSIEVRFFAPGGLVANLDFVESIFGNAGDPYHAANDARLDVDHWSGHTGCVILAPHLIRLTKREVGLPHVSEATERQVRDGMCWTDEGELYNDGSAFKITCRDHRGVIVTIIADNYFGYCKKEVKSQLSYASNLMGRCEEEHAGGALSFPSFDLGEDFQQTAYKTEYEYRFDDVAERFASMMHVHPEGYGIDREYEDIVYVPEDARIDLRKQNVSWTRDGTERELRLQPDRTYVLPSGYSVEMRRPRIGVRWRLVGTSPEGTFCHKPSTVSGGGKSEISKPITDSMIHAPIVTYDFESDFNLVEEIVARDFGDRFRNPREPGRASRPLLDAGRSLGSVVRLLSPSPEYTEEYNGWLASIPHHVRDLVLMLKRFHKPHWNNWRRRFGVDLINGRPGYELKFRKEPLVTLVVRVGFTEDSSWRTFALRKDFYASRKVQMEDDITASVVVPADRLANLHPDLDQPAYRFCENVESRLFQRPDEAIVRGYDRTAEADFAKQGNFFCNYEPVSLAEARDMIDDTILFDRFSPPIKRMIRDFVSKGEPEHCVSTANPRLVNGQPSKNPRYLQDRPDLANPRDRYLAEAAARLSRRVPPDQPIPFPVNSVLPGRRNNPSDRAAGIRPLAVYNPIHYQELPELFMEFVSSLTGKSPSTTGAGSEGALTKGPFNPMPAIVDLNNALVGYLLTDSHGFTTSAGFIGPKYRFDHDISLLIPEVWSRMFIHEREPGYLIEHGFLEKIDDFDHEGRTIPASRLGYRITQRFVNVFFGRVFSDPSRMFEEDMLQPERQSMEDYVDGIDNIVTTQKRVAESYFEDGTISLACPPLRALLHVMVRGEYEGETIDSPALRGLFTREALLKSDWYRKRLETQHEVDRRLWTRHVDYLGKRLDECDPAENDTLGLAERLEAARAQLTRIDGPDHATELVGTLGADPAVLNGT